MFLPTVCVCANRIVEIGREYVHLFACLIAFYVCVERDRFVDGMWQFICASAASAGIVYKRA